MVNLTYKNYDWNICVFVADTVDDFSDLPTMTTQGTTNTKLIPPCGMGSSVYTKDGKMYRLCGNNSWEEVPSSETITRADLEAALANYISKDDVDDALSDTSINPVQNKVVKATFANVAFLGDDSSTATIPEDVILTRGDIVNNLESTSTTRPLSANQGKVLNERMSNAISAVTTDTELTDIRVGADGKNYQTAGDAVRGQIGQLAESITDISEVAYQIEHKKRLSVPVGFFEISFPTFKERKYRIVNEGTTGRFTLHAYNDDIKVATISENGVASGTSVGYEPTANGNKLKGYANADTVIYAYDEESIKDKITTVERNITENSRSIEKLDNELSELNFIIDKSAFNIIHNKYCDSSADCQIYDGNGYAVTEPYLINKGDVVELEAIGLNTAVSMIAISDADNSKRICLVRSIDTTKRKYKYVAPADMYIVLSFAMSDYDIKIFKNKERTDSAAQKAIKNNSNPLCVDTVKKMSYNSSYTEHTNYCCSAPIKLTKGQKIDVTMRCETVVSAISKVNQDGTLISTILKGKGISQNNYSYIAENDCYVVLSFYVSKDYPSDFNCIVYYPVYDIIETIGYDVVDSMSFSMFERWGVIGDSFASGVYYDSAKGALDNHLQKSWGQILARKSGNTCVNFSMGGLYCGDWLTNNDRGLPFLLRESAKELYIIALGINDVGRLSGVQPLGTIADVRSDYSQNPNTFYGNYGKIIGNIKTHAPKAKIIMSTIPYNFDSAMIINNAIIAIAQHYGLPCLMVHTDKFFRSDYYWNNFEQDHPKSFMYGATANAYERLILENLKDNTLYWGNTFN